MRVFVAALTAVGMLLFGLAAPAAAVTLPDTPVGRQAAWLEEASRNLPVSEAEAREHVAPALVDSLGVDGLNDLLGQISEFTITSFRAQPMREDFQFFALGRGGGRTWHLVLLTQPDGLIGILRLSAVPGSWAELDQRLAALAPNASLLAARVDRHGRCRPVHSLAPTTPRPLGSVFKLYVLGTLAEAVRAGAAEWDEPLAIRQAWKADETSPFGSLPPGTVRTLREYADAMIFFSDNTATDHLIHRLGRDSVERQQIRFGMREPVRNVPFLTTREMTILKADEYPALAERYLALDRDDRRRLLDTEIAERLPPTDLWSEPRLIEQIEWFASAADVCRAYTGLLQQADTAAGAPVDQVLSLQGTVSLGLDPTRWPVGWFKGGSEPGVLARTYLAGTDDGGRYVIAMMINNPAARFGNDVASELLALTAGGFELLADRYR